MTEGFGLLPDRESRRSARSVQGGPRVRFWSRRLVAASLVTAAGLGGGAFAHEIPTQVTVRVFVKPAGERLNVLVRVPLEAMRDLNWPSRGQGYLDLERIDATLRHAAVMWISDNLEFYEEGTPLARPGVQAAQVALPSDRSFRSFQSALASVTGPGLPSATQIYWEQALLDVLLEYSIRSERSRFSIHPTFARLGLQVTTSLLFVLPTQEERVFQFSGDPGLIDLDPRWHQAAFNFVRMGFFHILDGIDHLLFLLCLVIPVRRFRSLVLVVTSFTVAHSITLLASAFGLIPTGLWFPPLIETMIALSILYMAIENILGINPERRWMITFGFGLVHGFGFSFALAETLQLAGAHLLMSLFSFNLGVEIGQLMAVAVLMSALHLLFRLQIPTRAVSIILSVLAGHTAWHWMIERGATLPKYSWPALTAATAASGLRWLMVLLALGGLVWLVSSGLNRWAGEPEPVDKRGPKGTQS